MKWLFGVCLILGLVSCNDKVVNSSTFDESLYSGNFDGGLRFQAIAPVLVAKCASCHNYHTEWSTYSEQDFKDEGLITENSVAASPIYYRLSNSPIVGPGQRNMPQGGSAALTDDEITLLAEWINNFEN